MQITNLTLAYLIKEIEPSVQGAYIKKFQELARDFFRIRLNTKDGAKDLLFCPKAIFLTSYKIGSAEKQGSFVEFARKHLLNKKIVSIEQHGFDRVVILNFDSLSIVFELFSEGNIIIIDKGGVILDPLKRQSWKDRKIARNEKYLFPASRNLDPGAVTAGKLKDVFKDGKEGVVSVLVKEAGIAPQIAEECCAAAGIDSKATVGKITDAKISKLASGIKKKYSLTLKCSPVIQAGALLPFALQHNKDSAVAVSSLNSALDESLAKGFLSDNSKVIGTKAEKALKALKFSLEQQKNAIETLEQKAELNKIRAEAIYNNFDLFEDVVNAVAAAAKAQVKEKDIMYKFKKAAENGNTNAAKLKSVDLGKKIVVLEV